MVWTQVFRISSREMEKIPLVQRLFCACTAKKTTYLHINILYTYIIYLCNYSILFICLFILSYFNLLFIYLLIYYLFYLFIYSFIHSFIYLLLIHLSLYMLQKLHTVNSSIVLARLQHICLYFISSDLNPAGSAGVTAPVLVYSKAISSKEA